MRIIYIDIDSLRPDHLGCYGYNRETSPAIDSIAREGVRFQNCYTADAPCLPSRTALYSGRFGIQTGAVGHGGTAAEPKREGPGRNFQDRFNDQGLACRLQRAGLHTTMISPFGQRHAAWHIYAGFHEVHNTGKYGMESAEHVMPVLTKWLDEHAAQDDWYLHVNFWDPHTPHRVPGEYGEPFADTPIPEWLNDDALIARHAALPGPHSALDISMYSGDSPPAYPRQVGEVRDRASMRKLIDGYDTAVRYVDDQIARVMAILNEKGIADDVAIIISADHGENYGELGVYAEHATADHATCRVPLIVKWPGGVRGAVADGLCYSLDLAPTFTELLGGETPEIWDGSSLAGEILRGEPFAREDLVMSQCAHTCQRSVRWDRYLYVRTYHCGFHLFPDEMLFDLVSDPHEQTDLALEMPELCREGAWRLARWHDAQMSKMTRNASDSVDPLWTVMREGGPFHARLAAPGMPGQPRGGASGFAAYMDRLRQTGRAQHADALEEKYAGWIRASSPA